MKLGRTAALACSLLLAAGCGGGGGSSPAPAAPSAPAPTPTPTPTPAPLYPAGSSAASYILANVNPAQTSVSRAAPSDADDGGWSTLQLPPLQQCGNGALATDCKVWVFAPAAGSAAARTPRTPLVGLRPPTFNFCRDAAAYPSDLGRAAIPITGLAGQSFSLAYSGTKAVPVVAFATRWWTVSLTNTFAANATIAPAIAVTPTITDTAARGWLLFFTWNWPADVLAIPFQINEVQFAASSSPMAIPPGSSATLGAFDCVGRPITATAAFGSGFGFSADLGTTSVTSPAAELNVPLYTGPAPAGSAILYDDRGAVVATPVT